MQRIASVILLLAFIGQTFDQGFLYVDYMLDKADYVRHCVNKSRPQMHCNGKCQLMKKIAEQEKNEQQKAPMLKLGAKMEIVPISDWCVLPSSPDILLSSQRARVSNEGIPIDRTASIFHPPGA